MNFLIQNLVIKIANSEGPDQTAPSGAVWSRYALFGFSDLDRRLKS